MSETVYTVESDAYLTAALARLRTGLPTLAPAWFDTLPRHLPRAWFSDRRRPDWEAALAALPHVADACIDARQGFCLRAAGGLAAAAEARVRTALEALTPWRKGPFSIFGIEVDAEWRSDLKWNRVAPHLPELTGRRVLDVGCGNGYYAWRLWGAGAGFVLGLDPAALAVMQFRALWRYAHDAPVVVLPLPSAALAQPLAAFDLALSMGVIYHRRDPLAHLRELRGALVGGGQLVLETLVVRGEKPLLPAARYARMRNVWVVPSPGLVRAWLGQTGFDDVRLLDVSATTTAEQRSTAWMPYESLAECLDADDPSRTVEGYPAPLRAVFMATAR
ncbi:MAG: tRNA 5-methoxyuridine(34)/uridine 5-oxyacetic acid(34) synthase CmoB [Gammaproteobacteria bacterium]|nr:tRNA 5-methoxyuridine(34)/uridine 5-oxyacetic acid(34) synthase CmoB [Gammaproteobacteria bacterium]MCP5201295.1 tRNA 5-methoxyuridine(34)/uridine 5-oxyacetic acid(34) synthase CmoB [Gammaproteobacteria bacterium]